MSGLYRLPIVPRVDLVAHAKEESGLDVLRLLLQEWCRCRTSNSGMCLIDC